jgi:dihydroflavonol-4-reductase
MTGRKIAITGASGHLGNTVCRLLIDQGYDVNALYHSDKRGLEGLDLNLFQGNVLNTDDLTTLIKGCDIVINCAAVISIHGDPTGIVYQTNTQGPKNVLEVCKQQKVKKLIHVSSVHAVLELPHETPFDESRAYKQKGAFAYDFSKATGEQIILKAIKNNEIEGFVLRPSSIVGPHDHKPSELGKALLDFYKKKIPALPEGGYNFIDIRDISKAVVESIGKGKNGEIYLLSGNYYSLKELASIIQKVSEKKMPKRITPFWLLKSVLPFIKLYSKISGGAPLFSIESISALKYGHPNMVNEKAQKEFGLQIRPLEETIADYFEWQKKRNIIQ